MCVCVCACMCVRVLEKRKAFLYVVIFLIHHKLNQTRVLCVLLYSITNKTVTLFCAISHVVIVMTQQSFPCHNLQPYCWIIPHCNELVRISTCNVDVMWFVCFLTICTIG